MTDRQTITLPFPPSVNSLYRNVPRRGRVRTDSYKQWVSEAGWELRLQNPEKFTERVNVTISMNPPRRNCGDVDNRSKAVLDLLVKHQVIPDDKGEFVASVLCKWVSEGPECTVELETVD
ncbi:RusA family crossover junction endodeoxyribonuclease [Martelella sp. FLE1502]